MIEITEWIHFGLTSQDINNTAIPLSIKAYLQDIHLPALNKLYLKLTELEHAWFDIPLLARTHGQPASPTTLGKEIGVFASRLKNQIDQLINMPLNGKFSFIRCNHYERWQTS